MNATVATVSTRSSISRFLILGTGAVMAFVLGAALALAATGWFAAGDRTAPAFDATGALYGHVLREYRGTATPAPAMQDTLHEHLLRENRAR